jgi:hypothetical protein
VSNGAVLFFNSAFTREMGGEYECVAYNKHGSVATQARFNVQCKYTFDASVVVVGPYR